jgi:homoserine acetyltransferase
VHARYTGSHHFAGRNRANGNQPGSWDGLTGPGRAIDTDKLFVVTVTDKLFVVRECRLLQSR